jgi:nitroreductase
MKTAITSTKQLMHERKSVRKYKQGVKFSQEVLLQLLQDATSAPSSSNTQPWRFLVIQDQEVKKELRSIANNQEQIETSSAVIAVLADVEMYKNAEEIYNANFEQGYMPREIADMMIENTVKLYSGLPQEVIKNIVHFDAGLISMQIMLLAKELGYDTVTMGGFNKAQFAEKFELPQNVIPVVLIAIGEAAEPARNTTRIPAEKLTKFI